MLEYLRLTSHLGPITSTNIGNLFVHASEKKLSKASSILNYWGSSIVCTNCTVRTMTLFAVVWYDNLKMTILFYYLKDGARFVNKFAVSQCRFVATFFSFCVFFPFHFNLYSFLSLFSLLLFSFFVQFASFFLFHDLCAEQNSSKFDLI